MNQRKCDTLPTKERPVVVTVVSAAMDASGQPEGAPMRLQVPGTVEKRGSSVMLHYTEKLEDEGDHTLITTQVHMLLAENRIVVMRKGQWSMMMVLEKGRRYTDDYHTPYGDLPMSVYPTQVSFHETEKGGAAVMRYQLGLQGGESGYHTIDVKYEYAS